ncbi:TPM domain-containing protein [Pyxidicoccus fallax]|uniref:TPM domain-containing protein n=1 Tax=Pyxidicoccus fallax TaxID=394095 RepID=A0A848LF91_9BACT|nr:TPM domain-containing protein [Pyxidicoccus fallax]NPC82209.1 TPM domain-containing protein [Pyxidicoccus fallax]
MASALVQLRRETGAQMAVLIVGTTRGEPIEDYALRAAKAWKGGGAGRDNGLLLVLAAHDRRQRLEVGYGLKAHLPDDAVRTLLEAQGPLLRQWNYRGALLGVVSGVRARLQGADGGVSVQEPWSEREVNHAFLWMMGSGLAAGVLIGFCFGPWWDRLGPARLAGAAGALLGVPMAAIALYVQSSQRPTPHFLLAFAAFTLVFCVATLVCLRSSLRWGLFVGSATLVGGGVAWVWRPPSDALVLSVGLAGLAGVIFVIVSAIRALLLVAYTDQSSGRHDPGTSSSSSSDSSWSSSSDSSSSGSSSSDSSWGAGAATSAEVEGAPRGSGATARRVEPRANESPRGDVPGHAAVHGPGRRGDGTRR